MKKSAKVVGVIVARFQIPALHEGHAYTVQYALDRHRDVLVILGDPYAHTDLNPLSFEMREAMVRATFPGQPIAFGRSPSLPSSARARSLAVDAIIARHFPGRPAVIYGARDSIAHRYEGAHSVCEVPTITSTSATAIRESIVPIDSHDFRAGVIFAAMSRPPVRFPAVDVALIDTSRVRVALVWKEEEEGKLRFPGTWLRVPDDTSLEDAAARCLGKELPGVSASCPWPVCSAVIPDWRFGRTRDGVVSTLFRADYRSGEPAVGQGVDGVRWVGLGDLVGAVVPEHADLARKLLRTL